MPPQPPGAPSLYGEPSIPGAATASEAPLRTHSAKYPVSARTMAQATHTQTHMHSTFEDKTASCLCPSILRAHYTTKFTLCKCKFTKSADLRHATTQHGSERSLFQLKNGIIKLCERSHDYATPLPPTSVMAWCDAPVCKQQHHQAQLYVVQQVSYAKRN